MPQFDYLAELRTALEDEFGLKPAADLAGSEKAAFSTQTVVKWKHFRPNYDLVVHDPVLSTLGLVRIIDPGRGGEAKENELRRRVDEAIREATYVRHLLDSDRRKGDSKPGRIGARSVELVLLIPVHTKAGRVFEKILGVHLQRTVRDTDHLHSIGVHVLRRRSGEAPMLKDLRRAFCWLLHANQLWFKARAKEVKRTEAHSLRSIETTHFRIAGKRTVELAEGASVHLISGRNGSGKSALVESLELAVTGRIDRLHDADVADYRKVVCNRDQTNEAQVRIRRGNGRWQTFVVTEDGTPSPYSDAIVPDSFRLNQRLMDQLAVSSAADRAETFLNAFFPEPGTGEALDQFRDAQQAERDVLAELSEILEQARKAQRALANLKSFTATIRGAERRDYANALNDWLEVVALTDLVHQQGIIDISLTDAGKAGWSPKRSGLTLPASFGPSMDRSPERMTRIHRVLERRRERAHDAITARPGRARSTRKARKTEPPSADQVQVLNEVGDLLFSAEQSAHGSRMGQAIHDAIVTSRRDTFARIPIGARGWATRLQNQIESVVKVLEDAIAGPIPHAWPTEGQIPDAFERLPVVREERRAQERALEETFVRKIGRVAKPVEYGYFEDFEPDDNDKEPDGLLNGALNELLALFTAARWAYEDVAIGIDPAEGARLRIGGAEGESARADLRFNTAELNLFTVSLFLLCAVRVENPINLLVLDDPLQNMDEMTVTMLARGLAKLIRVWEEAGCGLRILILLHGVRSIDRFRSEVPCAVYELPWLTPSAQGQDDTVVIDPSRSTLTVAK